MALAAGMIIIGLIIGFGGFMYSARSMDSADTTYEDQFSNHFRAMMFMALGSLISLIGLIIGGVQLIQSLAR